MMVSVHESEQMVALQQTPSHAWCRTGHLHHPPHHHQNRHNSPTCSFLLDLVFHSLPHLCLLHQTAGPPTVRPVGLQHRLLDAELLHEHLKEPEDPKEVGQELDAAAQGPAHEVREVGTGRVGEVDEVEAANWQIGVRHVVAVLMG